MAARVARADSWTTRQWFCPKAPAPMTATRGCDIGGLPCGADPLVLGAPLGTTPPSAREVSMKLISLVKAGPGGPARTGGSAPHGMRYASWPTMAMPAALAASIIFRLSSIKVRAASPQRCPARLPEHRREDARGGALP